MDMTATTIDAQTAKIEPQEISFRQAGVEVMRITQDGRLEFGEGLSKDEATQAAAKVIKQIFDELR